MGRLVYLTPCFRRCARSHFGDCWLRSLRQFSVHKVPNPALRPLVSRNRKARASASSGKQEVTSPHEVQLDAQHRVITAGGFVKTGPIVFEDASEKAGLTKWTHKMGTPEKNYIIETKGSGVGLIDYDNDGWLDIYLVNGSTIEALDGQGDTAACRAVSQQPRRNVYRRRGKGRRHQRPLGYWRGHCRL